MRAAATHFMSVMWGNLKQSIKSTEVCNTISAFGKKIIGEYLNSAALVLHVGLENTGPGFT